MCLMRVRKDSSKIFQITIYGHSMQSLWNLFYFSYFLGGLQSLVFAGSKITSISFTCSLPLMIHFICVASSVIIPTAASVKATAISQ